MNMDRRAFIGVTGLSVTASGWSALAAEGSSKVKVGMCDWNVQDAEGKGGTCRPELIPRAKEAGLEGIQVSVGTDPDHIPLRSREVRQKYIELGKEHGIAFHSVAAGGILNSIPLKTEPQSAVYVIDAIEAAAALGAKNILIAFFGDADLRLTDSIRKFRNLSKGEFKSYELDSKGVCRTVEALKQIVPRAEDLGVALGLENTLTAEQNLEIIDRIGGSPILQVYYDVGNSTAYGYDIATEIRLLGNQRICEIHLKDSGLPVLGTPKGKVNFAGAAEACRAIKYDKWFVLETSGAEKRFIEDTRANVEFAKKQFG